MLDIRISTPTGFISLPPYFVNVKYTLELDMAGSFSFEYPLVQNLSYLLKSRAKIEIYNNGKYHFGGIIELVERRVVNDVPLLSISGSSYLIELRDEVTLPNIMYSNRLLTSITDPFVADTINKVNGWTFNVLNNEYITYLSSLQPILSVLKVFKDKLGIHYRFNPIPNTKTVDLGKFGENSDVVASNFHGDRYNLTSKQLIIDNGGISIKTDASDICNCVIPVAGAGDSGANQTTLRDTTVTDSSYPVQVVSGVKNTDRAYNTNVFSNTETSPNTALLHFIDDSNSIAQYGLVKRALSVKDIHPVSANQETYTNSDRRESANTLYKTALEYLLLHKDPLVTYAFNAQGLDTDLLVGQTIKLKFSGQVTAEHDTQNQLQYSDIDIDLYLVGYTCEFSENNVQRYSLKLANLLRQEFSDIDVIADTVETVNQYSKQRTGGINSPISYFQDVMDSTHPAEFPLILHKDSVYYSYLDLKVKLKPFRATSTGATSSATATTTTATATTTTATTSTAGGLHSHNVSFSIPAHTHNVSLPAVNTFPAGANGVPLFVSGLSSPELSFSQAGAPAVLDLHSATGSSTSSAGGLFVSTVTSAADGSHSHTIPAVAVNIPPLAVNIPPLAINIVYGIFENVAQPPTGLSLWIDGVNYSPNISIPDGFGSSPAGVDQWFDVLLSAQQLGTISSLLTAGEHTIEIRCSGGMAQVQLFVQYRHYLSAK